MKILESVPGNAKYTSPMIQKELLNIIANNIWRKIHEKVRNAKFCILVDEAVDESHKEQIDIIFRFVDCGGVVRERFFEICRRNYCFNSQKRNL